VSSLLTNSRAKTARACPRKHHIEYELGYRPVVEAEELTFGTLIHNALAAWWALAKPGVLKLARLNAALEFVEQSKVDPFISARARVMLIGYHARWADEPYEIVAVEEQFDGPLINPDTGHVSKLWRIGGKLDGLIRHTETGEVWLTEHKSSAEDLSPGGIYWRRLRMDSQVSIYFDGAKLLGHDVTGCIYDVLAKPTQRPLKATPVESRKFKANGELYANQRAEDETPDAYGDRLVEAITAEPAKYFARIEVPRLDSELNDARRDLWQLAQRLREDERLERAPRNVDACLMYGRVCPFFDVCSGVASLGDGRLFRRSYNVHPELEKPQ
jgi:hypothetical protein